MRSTPSGWFAIEELAPRTWLVSEPGHVNCYLVAGDERAVLIDTGLGIADLRAAVEGITDLPVLVVNTHSHSDHRGANWRFDRIAAHPLAAPALVEGVDPEYLAGYLVAARAQLAAYERAVADDDRFFHLFTETTRPRPLPEDADAWSVPGGPPAVPLLDGDTVDLGGRTLDVIHTPGHSPDSLCLIDSHDGLLFAGDTLITGDFWAHTPDTQIEVFAATLRSLADRLAGSLRTIHPAHTLRYRVEPAFLTRAADAFEAVIDGTSVGRPGSDLLQRPVLRHEFAEFSILRPAA